MNVKLYRKKSDIPPHYKTYSVLRKLYSSVICEYVQPKAVYISISEKQSHIYYDQNDAQALKERFQASPQGLYEHQILSVIVKESAKFLWQIRNLPLPDIEKAYLDKIWVGKKKNFIGLAVYDIDKLGYIKTKEQ